MPSPFPGMDPYLESPDIWPDLHHELISQIRAALNPGLRPRYVARVELRVYVTDPDDPGIEVIIPDVRLEKAVAAHARKQKVSHGAAVAISEAEDIPGWIEEEIKEARLEIRHRETGSLVAIIEIVSPANKVQGSNGRKSFLEKRREAIEAGVHWIEIDLLRAGIPSVAKSLIQPSDYRVLQYRAVTRRARYWRFDLRDPLPTIGIPLRRPDPDIPLELGKVFHEAYEHGAYDLSIDYRKDPAPAWNKRDKAWAHRLLRERGLR